MSDEWKMEMFDVISNNEGKNVLKPERLLTQITN